MVYRSDLRLLELPEDRKKEKLRFLSGSQSSKILSPYLYAAVFGPFCNPNF